MPSQKEDLKTRLGRTREIKISVTGRKTGATITLPVWFIVEGNTLYLLPVAGSDTQWFKNLERHRFIGIASGGVEANFRATLVREPRAVKSVVEKFRAKYGAADVKKYYSKFDVAVRLSLSRPASAAA